MFKNSYKNVGFVSNPQYFDVNPSENAPEIDEDNMLAKILLFSGQNIKDFRSILAWIYFKILRIADETDV